MLGEQIGGFEMLSLEVEVNGIRVTTAGVADAEKIDAVVTLCQAVGESWVKVSGEVMPADQPPADASWFHRPLTHGDSVTIRLVDAREPNLPTLTRSDPGAKASDAIPHACSFCGKPSTAIGRMYAGPKAQICNECVDFMHGMETEDCAATG